MACSCVGTGILQQDVGKVVPGRRLAFLGPVGQCASAYSIHPLESSNEVWAAWRALFVPSQEGASGGSGPRGVQTLPLCGNAQGVCADWSTLFGSRRRSGVQW